jgi:hypothetical protein
MKMFRKHWRLDLAALEKAAGVKFRDPQGAAEQLRELADILADAPTLALEKAHSYRVRFGEKKARAPTLEKELVWWAVQEINDIRAENGGGKGLGVGNKGRKGEKDECTGPLVELIHLLCEQAAVQKVPSGETIWRAATANLSKL